MNNLLAVRDLHKSFVEGGNEIHVLRGVNLNLGEGERLAVVGESGVGNSTLIHILGTLDHFTSGEILFDGKQVPVKDEAALCRFRNRQIGFVFQFHYLLPDFSALENVMFPALVQGMEAIEARRQAEELLTLVGLKDRLSHRPGKLSGGEQQRVAVARAVILKPKLVLADEPTGSLDPRIGEGVQNLLFRLNEEHGIALIVATHNRQFAESIGRRAELREGLLFGVESGDSALQK
jgi:lipoprotein-releasing system ATP-binding protein